MNAQSNNAAHVKTELMLVTPSLAENWLRANTCNRNISKHVVEVYAADMGAGRWEVTNQGVAFYSDGVLADGQHRLHAVILANVAVYMQVTYGLSRSAINGIDQHKIRAIKDVLTMQGTPTTAVEVAAIRLCFGLNKATASLVGRIASDVISEIRFVDEYAVKTNQKFTSAIIRASIALALKGGADRESVANFIRVLSSGIVEKDLDRTVIVLRESLLSNSSKQRGGSERVMLVKKVQQAIKNYCDGKIVTRSIAPAEYVYPLLTVKDN